MIWIAAVAVIFFLIYRLQPPHGKLDERTFDFFIGRFPLVRICEFAAGCCASLIFQRQNRIQPIGEPATNRILLFAGGAMLLGLGAIGLLSYFKFTSWTLAITPGAGLLVIGLAARRHVLQPLLEKKLMLLLGESSYALYLLQWIAIVFFRQSRFGVIRLPGLLAIMFGCVTLAAW